MSKTLLQGLIGAWCPSLGPTQRRFSPTKRCLRRRPFFAASAPRTPHVAHQDGTNPHESFASKNALHIFCTWQRLAGSAEARALGGWCGLKKRGGRERRHRPGGTGRNPLPPPHCVAPPRDRRRADRLVRRSLIARASFMRGRHRAARHTL